MGPFRMLASRCVRLWLWLFLSSGAACLSAEIKQLESPLEIAPFASVTAYAAKHDISLDHIALAPEATQPRAGDSIVYLLTLQQASGRKQWLVRLTSSAPDPTKGELKTLPDDVMYSSTGLELRYTNTPVALEVEFIGPFAPNTTDESKISTSRGRAVVSAESLQLGMVRYCESALPIAARMKAAGIAEPFYRGSGAPLKPDVLDKGRKAAAAIGLTPEDERLAFSVYFALRSFYQACSEIPACREVLEQVIQKPSLLSLAKNLGLATNFEYGWHRVQPVPDDGLGLDTPSYLLPLNLSLNQRPSLAAALLVGTTRPPLRTCAGILALGAAHPTDDSKRVYLRVMSARPAGS